MNLVIELIIQSLQDSAATVLSKVVSFIPSSPSVCLTLLIIKLLKC